MEHGTEATSSAGPEDRRPLYEIGVSLLLAIGALALSVAWIAVLFRLAQSLTTEQLQPTETSILLQPPALALGVATAALAYFANSRHDVSFLDLRRPGVRELGYATVGVVVLLAISFASEFVVNYAGLPAPQHSTAEYLQQAPPSVILYFAAAGIVFIGPAEELLFRNLIQKRLSETFSAAGAIGISSVPFVLAHTSAYFTGHTGQLLVSLVTVFLLSLVLGYLYHRTESLLVVVLVHGFYDAVVFGLIYVDRFTTIGG